jgi:cbb3-type cytochrome oxidase cytochrome c subunit
MFENKSGILLIGGLGFFLFAFLSNGLVPILMYRKLPVQTVAQVINQNTLYQFEDLRVRYPEQFAKHYGEATREACEEALRIGRKVYIGEGCWHCHSQFVRPVSNESVRWGQVASSEEYQNELQQPVMFGTRRVGPDLSREGGRRSNDWHAVHFWNPPRLSTGSPMPRYPWFFDGLTDTAFLREIEQRHPQLFESLQQDLGEDLSEQIERVVAAVEAVDPELVAERIASPVAPNKRGLAIMLYVQWLGSWLESYPLYEDYVPLADQLNNAP